MNEQILQQILTIRATAKVNMFDTHAVQRLAHEMKFYELVIYIEENRKAYAQFILTGN